VSSRPDVPNVAEHWYTELQVSQPGDDQRDWPLLKTLGALAYAFCIRLHDIVRDADEPVAKVDNSSGADGTTGWVPRLQNDAPDGFVAMTHPVDGSQCFRLVRDADGGGSSSIYMVTAGAGIVTEPGQIFAIAAEFRGATIGRSSLVSVLWYDDAGVEIGTLQSGAAAASTTTGWTSATFVTGPAPVGAAFMKARAAVVTAAEGEAHYVRNGTAVLRNPRTILGWTRLLDPERCPGWALPWLAQFAGVKLTTGLTEAQQREQITSPPAFLRGTPAATRAAVATKSTSKDPTKVRIVERTDGDPHRYFVIVDQDDYPDLAPAGYNAATWHADAERPWEGEWTSYAAAERRRITRVPSPHSPGRSSLRFEVLDGDAAYVWNDPTSDPDPLIAGTSVGERTEVSSANPTGPNGVYPTAGNTHYHVFREGDDRWIGQQLYLPSTSVIGPGYTIITQLKALGAGGGSPVLALMLSRSTPLGATRFRVMATNNPDPTDVGLAEVAAINIPLDQPVKILWRVKFHRDPAQGHVTCLVDIGAGFTTVLAQTSMTTMCDPDPVSGGNTSIPGWDTVPMSLARMGIYRDPANSGDATLYFDGFAASGTRAVTEHLAFRAPITPVTAGSAVTGWASPEAEAAARSQKPVGLLLNVAVTDAPLLMEYTRPLSAVTVPIAAAALADVT
jgi:hypothetical protein